MYSATHTLSLPCAAYFDLSQHHSSAACLLAKSLGRLWLKPVPPPSFRPQAVAEGKPDELAAAMRSDERVVESIECPGRPVAEGTRLHCHVFAGHHTIGVRIGVTQLVQERRDLFSRMVGKLYAVRDVSHEKEPMAPMATKTRAGSQAHRDPSRTLLSVEPCTYLPDPRRRDVGR